MALENGGLVMSTILDVEKISGVSKSTISRYLRGRNVRDDKKALIESAIKELDYKLNPMASSLKTNKTMTIGIVLPRIADPFFPPIVKEIEKSLRDNGYRTLISNYDDDPLLEIKQVELMRQYRVDGLIVAPTSDMASHLLACEKSGIPVVLIDRDVSSGEFDSVYSDHYQASFDILSFAVRKGHKKIAILRGQDSVFTDVERFRAYKDVLERFNIPFNPDYVAYAGINNHAVSREFMRIIDSKDPPTLIFATNVYMSIGVLEAIIEYGVHIPDEVSVVSFDRLSSFPYMNFVKGFNPEIASVCQNLPLIAEKSVELLLKRINEGIKDGEHQHIEVKSTIVMTDSVKTIV